LQKLLKCLLKWPNYCAFPLVMSETPYCVISSLAFDVVASLNFSNFSRYVMLSHYCFNFQFPKNILCWTFFDTLTTIYVLWGRTCSRFSPPIFNGIACLSIIEFYCIFLYKYSLYISDVCFPNIFFHFLTYLLIVLTVSFKQCKFLVLMKSRFSSYSSMNYVLLLKVIVMPKDS
jgi:hypothetical protein